MGDIRLESDEKCETEKINNILNTRSDVSYRIGRPATFQAIEQESKFKANDKKKCFLFFSYSNLSSSVSTSYRNSSLLVCSAVLALLANGIFDFNNNNFFH